MPGRWNPRYDLAVTHKPESKAMILLLVSLLAVATGWAYFIYHYGP